MLLSLLRTSDRSITRMVANFWFWDQPNTITQFRLQCLKAGLLLPLLIGLMTGGFILAGFTGVYVVAPGLFLFVVGIVAAVGAADAVGEGANAWSFLYMGLITTLLTAIAAADVVFIFTMAG